MFRPHAHSLLGSTTGTDWQFQGAAFDGSVLGLRHCGLRTSLYVDHIAVLQKQIAEEGQLYSCPTITL